ncbi:MAG: sulfotransferase domain-containing protein [Bacteroidota bacterium]
MSRSSSQADAPLRTHSGPSSGDGALPTFVIIGAMKCGTTSLHYYLGMHPEIGMSKEKELAFFPDAWNWARGEGWYRRRFDAGKAIRGEASPHYTCHPQYPNVPERMHALLPEAKLIYLVRDPVERLVSHYLHDVARGFESEPLAEAVLAPDSKYLARSQYHRQIERYLPFYDPEAILVLDQADLRKRRRETLRRVFAFVGADPEHWDARFHLERHTTARKRRRTPAGERLARSLPMKALRTLVPIRYRWPLEDAIYYPFSRPMERPEVTPDLHAALADRLGADLARWRAFTGRDFAHWSL